MPSVGAIVAAAGSGSRLGRGSKALVRLNGRTTLARVLELFLSLEEVDRIVVVGPPARLETAEQEVAALHPSKPVLVRPGGESRQESVRAGIAALGECDYVLVHDAARPLASPALVRRVLAAAIESGAAFPAISPRDAVKRVEGNRLVESLDRSRVVLAQTPQGFAYSLLARAARGGRRPRGHRGPGRSREHQADDARGLRRGRSPHQRTGSGLLHLRVGIGYDLHPLREGRPLVIGGVRIDHPSGLDGHSDADVLTHAVIDAILGAAGLGDIGAHFPPDDSRYRDASSIDLLAEAARVVANAGYRIVNIDSTVVAQSPRLQPHLEQMSGNIAHCLGLDHGSVSVKATSPEKIGALGGGAGIAAQAVALIDAT